MIQTSDSKGYCIQTSDSKVNCKKKKKIVFIFSSSVMIKERQLSKSERNITLIYVKFSITD